MTHCFFGKSLLRTPPLIGEMPVRPPAFSCSQPSWFVEKQMQVTIANVHTDAIISKLPQIIFHPVFSQRCKKDIIKPDNGTPQPFQNVVLSNQRVYLSNHGQPKMLRIVESWIASNIHRHVCVNIPSGNLTQLLNMAIYSEFSH